MMGWAGNLRQEHQAVLLLLPGNTPDIKSRVSGSIQRLFFLVYSLNIALMSTCQAGQRCLTEGRPSFFIAQINVGNCCSYLESEVKVKKS